MTEYHWDTRCPDLEFDRLEKGYTSYDFTNFSRVLLQGFARVVGDVHIETGSLLSSIKVEPGVSTPAQWSGEISAGGASAGVNGVVRYAASEFFGTSPRHGGPPSHSYFKNLGWVPNQFGEYNRGRSIEEDMSGPAASFFERGQNTPHPEGPIR